MFLSNLTLNALSMYASGGDGRPAIEREREKRSLWSAYFQNAINTRMYVRSRDVKKKSVISQYGYHGTPSTGVPVVHRVPVSTVSSALRITEITKLRRYTIVPRIA